MTDFRALCAELLQLEQEQPAEYTDWKMRYNAAMARARAALAQSEPPSLKEQALEELKQLRGDANSMGMGFDAPTIRRALEALPDD
jgi:hypothetical protein